MKTIESIPINRDDLQNLLRAALGIPILQLVDWQIQPIKGGLELASDIHRITGTALSAGYIQSWSMILKTVRPSLEFTDPHKYRYWKREVLTYQSDLLNHLPGQISAPRCYDIQEQPDGAIWLWLEDITDSPPLPWSLSIYSQVAYRLGYFNGYYLAHHTLPDVDWITHDWLRQYVEHAAPMVEFLENDPNHPLVKMMLPGIALPMSLSFWQLRSRLLKVLDELPQTFCHLDAFGRNLFNCPDRLKAIDWGYAGIAPIGAELASLIGMSCSLDNFPVDKVYELDRICFESYLEGVHQAGYTPDTRQVRLGYTLTVVMRYIFGATVGEMLPGLLDEKTQTHWVEGLKVPPEKAGETQEEVAAYYQSIAIEALRTLGLPLLIRFILKVVTIAFRLKIKPKSGDRLR